MEIPKDASHNTAVIFLHPACNMTCSFCITEDNFDVMSGPQVVQLLDILKAENFKSIVLGGGEPFFWPGNLPQLARQAKDMGFLVQVGTNAIALPKHYESIDSIDRYVLPLESVDPAIHNQMRVYKGKHHQLIMDRLHTLRRARKSVTVSTIITQVNKDSLKALALFLKELDEPQPFIHAWHLYKFIPQGRGGRPNAQALIIPDEEYALICAQAKTIGLPFPVYQRNDMYRSRTVDFFWYRHGRLERASLHHHPQICH